MSVYNKVLQAIKSTLEAEFKVGQAEALLNEVKIMSNGFNRVEDILNFSDNAPAVAFGIKSFPTIEMNYSDQLESVAAFSLYLITSDEGKENVGDGVIEAYRLLEKLQLLIQNGKWNLIEVWKTENNSMVCNNYYYPEFDQKQITLWELIWRQRILLGENKWEIEPMQLDRAIVNVDINSNKKESITIKIVEE